MGFGAKLQGFIAVIIRKKVILVKALMYTGVKKLEIVDLPNPEPKEGELLLKVKSCGICGSDVHGWLGLTGRRIAPMVMGHEFSAEVVGFGKGCSNKFSLGDLVTIQPCISCGECDYCRKGSNNLCTGRKFLGAMDFNGALQEYLCVPEKIAFALPSSMSHQVGSLIEAFAVSYSAVKKAGDLSGKNVVIIGGGTIGLMALAAVKVQNPNKILLTDLSALRLKTAKKMGADEVLNPINKNFLEEVKKAFNGKLADVSIEAVGVGATVAQSLEALAPQGCSIWIGNSSKMVEVDMQSIVTQELKIYGSYIYSHEEFGESIKFIEEHKLDLEKFISNEITFSEAQGMFESLATDTEKFLKCVVTF